MPAGIFAYTVERLDTWVLKISIAIPVILIVLLIVLNLVSHFARKLFAKPRKVKLDTPRLNVHASSLAGEIAVPITGPLAQAITATPSIGGSATNGTDRKRHAREMLSSAKEDFQARQFSSCLERCDELAIRYADLVEGSQAKDLADHIKTNPQLLERACTELANSLANRYLELADSRERNGQREEAIVVLKNVVQSFPETNQSRVAADRLRALAANV